MKNQDINIYPPSTTPKTRANMREENGGDLPQQRGTVASPRTRTTQHPSSINCQRRSSSVSPWSSGERHFSSLYIDIEHHKTSIASRLLLFLRSPLIRHLQSTGLEHTRKRAITGWCLHTRYQVHNTAKQSSRESFYSNLVWNAPILKQ